MQVEQTKLLEQLKNKTLGDDSNGIKNYARQSHAPANRYMASDGVSYRKTEEEMGIFAANSAFSGVYGKTGKENSEETAIEKIEGNMEVSVSDRRNQMAVLSNTTSPEDYEKMQEEGFSMSETDSHTIITVTDKIKAVMAKAGEDIPGSDLSEAELEEITGSEAAARKIAHALKSRDLPDTEENMEDAQEALEQMSSLDGLDDAAISYMLKNGLEPTISNLYTAQHSSAGGVQGAKQEIDYAGMEEQIQQIIEDNGLEADARNIQNSRWLINNGIALDGEHLTALRQLQELSGILEQGVDKDGAFLSDIIDAMAAAVAEGKRPQDALLVPGYSLEDRAQAAMDTILDATDEDLADCIARGEEITIGNLRAAISRREGGSSVMGFAQQDVALLTARRQLEEIRLAMTTEANYALLKKGISIDTKPLEELVEDLKRQEDAYYRELLESEGVEPSDENVRMFADTTEMVEELRYQPAYTLNPASTEETLPQLHEAGAALQDTFTKANESYETMMTAPRADLGDSIRKAFSNVDDILKDLGLETSEANRRAVRILAYNETELTVENINRMKYVDEEVQQMFRGMTPAVTLEIIRRGENPLDMTVSQLHQLTEEIRGELGYEDTERFSKFLYKLEQNNQISEEERSGYIGIYRLIAQVEKTDGAVIGSLLNRGADITMRNLLSEVRTRSKHKMDYKVDDEFDGVSAKAANPRIDDQIQAAFQQDCIRDAKEQLAPEKMMQMTPEELLELTPEELAEFLKQAQEDPQADNAYVREELSRYSEVFATSEDVYAYLDRYDIPNSMINIIAASRMLQSPGQMFKSLWKGANAQTAAALKEEVFKRFGEAIKNPKELAEAQETLADTAEHVMEGMIIEEQEVTSLDIHQMRIMSRQFTIAARQSREECFMIPMQTGDEITGVSLRIVRGRKEKGMVDILFDSDRLGKVAASFEAKEGGIAGMIAVDTEEAAEFFGRNMDMLEEQLRDGTQDVNIRVARVPGLSLGRYGANALHREQQAKGDASEEGNSKNPVQTRRLYHIAESFLSGVLAG